MDCKTKCIWTGDADESKQSVCTVQKKRLTGGPAKIMGKNVWSRKMCIHV